MVSFLFGKAELTPFVMNSMMKIPGVVRVIYLPIGLVCCLIVGVVLHFVNLKGLNRFLGAAGKYSFGLYMIHVFLRAIYRHYMPGAENQSTLQGIVIWFVIMCVSALLSIFIHNCLAYVKISLKRTDT